MTTTSEKILKTIKESNVRPQPKWKFLVKNWLTLFMFVFSLLVGSLSFAVMLDIIVRHDWDIYFYLHKTFLQYLLLSLPYVWIVLLILFFAVAYYDFIHIRGWYRHRVYLVVAASIIMSFGCGFIFFFAGFGKNIDRVLTKRVPFYGRVKINKEDLWNHPNEGLLSGEIIEVKNENEFVLEDNSGKQWTVRDASSKIDIKGINEGENVEMIGRMENEDRFVAKNVREADNEKEDEFIRKKERLREKKNGLKKESDGDRLENGNIVGEENEDQSFFK